MKCSSTSSTKMGNTRVTMEALPPRQLLSATPTLASALNRSIDGTGNNLVNSSWGSAGIDLLRKAAAAYADGFSKPAGEDRPSAREISNEIVAHPEDEEMSN